MRFHRISPAMLLAAVCLLPAVFLMPAVFPSAAARATADERPNVLLIITDEHNFRTLGCYRELMPREQAEMWGVGATVPTPYLDRLARDGVLCTRAYATSPVCSPCRAAMITGRYPHATGVPTNNKVLDRSIPTLADRLNEAGYRSAFIGKWHLGGDGKPEWQPAVDGGFQHKNFMFNRGHWKKFVVTEKGIGAVGAVRQDKPTYALDGADEKTFSTDWLTDRALEFMTDDEATKPFFTVISYPDPHGPNTVRPPYDHRFDDLPFTAPRTYRTGVAAPKWLGSAKKHPVFRGDDMSRYFGMVQCLDDNIGRLLDQLERAGRLDNTLIVMTSDHGDLCYEHDRLNKGNPYEGSARVPMILRQPGRIAAGEYYTQPIGTVDLTPTILGLLELPGDPNDHGRDLSSHLADAAKPLPKDKPSPVTFLRNSGVAAGWVAAVDARYKLILSVSDVPWLFDAKNDPDELRNFYGRPETDEVVKRLATSLRQYGLDTNDPHLQHPKIAASLAKTLGEEVPAHDGKSSYLPEWKGTRQWIGPDWWANPLTDWSLKDGDVVAAAAADRTLCLLPWNVGAKGTSFEMEVQITFSAAPRGKAAGKSAAGFRIGRRGGIADYRHALVHATDWVDATVRGDGRISLGDQTTEQRLALAKAPVLLRLSGQRDEDHVTLTLTAMQGDQEVQLEAKTSLESIGGGISLLADGPRMPGGVKASQKIAFRDFRLSGDMATRHAGREFGPILWSQYTVSGKRLRLLAQFAPLGPRQAHHAELWLADSGESPSWKMAAREPLDPLSRTAIFTVDGWDGTSEKRYQIRFSWRKDSYAWDGRIRKEPEDAEPLRLACFSCDNGYLFPLPMMVSQVARQDPDVMYFAGDQIYESYGGFGVARGAPTPLAMLDYLRKYYQFGWTWRELMRDRPTIILPDDHDVFQGNLWGHGGRPLPESNKKNNWALGGYRMPVEWVNAVERTQVGHLPDASMKQLLPTGIRPYFTHLTYGGVGFAILEDRKFKTGPLSMPEARRADGQGAEQLGPEQESFLEQWSQDWSGHRMKCALSQTIFCTAATHTGRELKRTRSFFDSGAWPKAARNRVVRTLADCKALAIHGDQHLGVLLRHGVDTFDDAGYAFMVPGTANGFPRAWWPGFDNEPPPADQDFTGKFHDDAGNPLHILAVGNPEPGSNKIPKSAGPMEIGYRKGSGYGLVDFDKTTGKATISLYRLGDQDEMFPGFPQTLDVGLGP